MLLGERIVKRKRWNIEFLFLIDHTTNEKEKEITIEQHVDNSSNSLGQMAATHATDNLKAESIDYFIRIRIHLVK